MKVVITMAGIGSRFQKAGYTVPKYEIIVCGHTLFYWSMLSLAKFDVADYIFVVRKENSAENFIHSECKMLNIHPIIVELDYMTSGQAETAMLAAPYWNKEDALLIYNIDTYVEPGAMNQDQIRGDGFIPCFCGKGDQWSFVRLNKNGRAEEVREKKRISNHCTIGAYYFRTARLYEDLYNEYYIDGAHLEMGERYVAPLYNLLIAKGGEVYICDVPATQVHVLGTPEEVEQFKAANEAKE